MIHNTLFFIFYFFIMIRSIFEFQIIFLKLLINLVQSLAWFEVHFPS